MLSLLLAVAGCQAISAEPLPTELAGSDPQTQVDFWHALPARKAISNDEALHGLILFADGQDPAGGYAERAKSLKDKQMLPASFNEPANWAARRGTLAVVLVRILAIKGGLTLHVFGAQPRYAVRELEYAGLYPPSSPQQTFSGAEFMGIIGRAEDYQRGQAGVLATPILANDTAVGPVDTPASTQTSSVPATAPAP